jgi:hypothetical protein
LRAQQRARVVLDLEMEVGAGGVAAAAAEHQELPRCQPVPLANENLRAVAVRISVTVASRDDNPMPAVAGTGHFVHDPAVHCYDFGAYRNRDIPGRVVVVRPV